MIAVSESIDSLTTPLIRSPISNANPQTDGRTKKKRNKKFSMFCILLAVVMERLAYYSLLGNLVVYLTTILRWNTDETLSTTLLFTGFTWLSCFIGGTLGDIFYGRMNTITLGLIGYTIGFIFLPFISYVVGPDGDRNGKNPLIVIWFVISMLLISLGEGCFKSNMSPFGADQQLLEDDKKKFFSYYYWAINVGSFLGYGPVVLLQDRINFESGHGTAAGCLIVALIVFMLPRIDGYIGSPPAPNTITRVFKIIREARKNRKKNPEMRIVLSPSEYTGSGCYEDFVPMKHWLDRAMAKYGGTYLEIEVEEVKILLDMLPVFGFLVTYCILYYQTNSTFVLQGMHMDLDLNTLNFSIPVAWLALTNVIFVLIFVPVISKGLYPCLKKLKIHLSYFSKIMIGMFIASLAMVSAGVVEHYRLSVNGTVENKISHVRVTGKHISIFLQIPQFGLMGISEIFVMITGLEFAYCQAPKKMQAIVTGLFFIANGIGSMLGSALFEAASRSFKGVTITSSSQGKTLTDLKGHLDYFFYGLAALNFLNLLAFAIYSHKKKKKSKTSPQSVDDYLKSNLRRSPQKT